MFLIRLKHSKEELKKKQADMKKTDSNYKQDKATYDSAKKNMLKIEVNACSILFK